MTRHLQIALVSVVLIGLGVDVPAQPPVPYMNYAPVWSPDGDRIAFYGTAEGDWNVYTINTDGSNLVRLTANDGYDGSPTWSPDGSQLAFVSDRDGDNEVYTINTDGSNVRQITNNKVDDNHPAWSPTGEGILIRRSENGFRHLYLVAPSGTSEKRLSDLTVSGRARWSNNGQEIVFTIERESKQEIHRISGHGESLGVVTTAHDFPGNPNFSPDGTTLLYDAHADGTAESGDGKWELWTVRIDGAETKRLTSNDVDDWGGHWSPDGTRIAFAGGGMQNSGYEITVVDLAGRRFTQLTRRRK